MALLNLSLSEVKNQLGVKGQSTIISTKIPSDLLTPVSSLLKIKNHYPDYHFLFESVEKGNNRSRFSVIGLMPDLVWKCENKSAYISHKHPVESNFKKIDGNPLKSLRSLINDSQIPQSEDFANLSSGIFGYMSYDMVKFMEELPDNNLQDDINIADSIFIRPKIIIVFDSLFDVVNICAPIYHKDGIDTKSIYTESHNNIENIINILIDQPTPNTKKIEKQKLEFTSNFTEKTYCQAVEKSKEFITNGDIFQVLPSQRFSAEFDQDNSFSFYRSLRSINPSPFLFYLQFPDFCFTGSSPEIMVSCKDKKVTIRPLAGTRKRGKNEAEDQKISEELIADKKEAAEHLMLIDLGRHDVGKVCKDNSVKLTEKMIVEYYSHVMHISSNVEGILKDDLESLDALISGFPAGTVSGAPKIRAMEIIEELEKDKRGFYAGCVGYFSGNGDMETCISLRCALIKDNKIHLQTGAGVVFDSDPKSEYQECLSKARALMQAAQDIYKY